METEAVLRSINNIYLNGVRIAALNEEGTAAYFLTDQVDSVAHILDEGAHTLSRTQYEPYGETLVQRGNLDFAPKFNSQELDRETNFYFYNARYYDPQIARFTSADTVIDGSADTQGWNRFAYVKGNPIRYKDPTGHIIPVLIAIAVGAVGVAEILLDTNDLDAPTHTSRAATAAAAEQPDALDIAGEMALDKGKQLAAAKGVEVAAKVVRKNVSKCPKLLGKLACGGASAVLDIAADAMGSGNKKAGKVNKSSSNNGSTDVPSEPYNRVNHYGRSPTKADRKAMGANSDEVLDHDPPLVKRYYEGDPKLGEKPGFKMTPDERAASAADRNRMQRQPKADSNKQGGEMSKYSKDKKKELGL